MTILSRNSAIWISILILGLAIAFIPFNFVITPERDLVFVSSSGLPLNDALVDQTWYQYALGVRGNVELKTNSEGYLFIPKRAVRTNILSLLRGSLKQFKKLGVHAGYGSSEIITIFLNDRPIKWFYDGKGLESDKVIIDLVTDKESNLDIGHDDKEQQ